MKTKTSTPLLYVDIVGSIMEKMTIPGTVKLPTRQSPSLFKKPEKEERFPETVFGQGTESVPVEPGRAKPEAGTPFTDKDGSAESTLIVPKDFLFDKEIIEKYAGKGDAQEKDLTFDVPEFHHRGYMRMLKEKIESIWEYPQKAANLGISGELYIRFSIRRDGSLGGVNLVRTSGYSLLDKAALKALTDAEPYWPLPDDWKGDELSITGHFIYLTGRAYIL